MRGRGRSAAAAATAATTEMGAAKAASVRRGAGRAGDAFADEARSAKAKAGRAPSAMASKAGLADDEAGHFFSRSDAGPADAGRPPQPPPPPADDLDTAIDDFDSYDATTAFESIDDFDREPTPALLAAKAEPLGGAPSTKRPPRKSVKSNRSKAGEAARVSKTRAKSRPKTKEPSKLWLGAGLLAVLLAGFATAYFVTRGSGDETVSVDEAEAEATDDLTATSVEGDTATDVEADDEAVTEATTSTEVAAAPSGVQPVVIFDDAAVGPINAGTEYTIGVGEGPEGAMYQLRVDGEAQADPAPELPPVVFTPGRHLLVIDITSPTVTMSTNPVLVYAVGELPAANWRANLSSVDIANEGWAEAARQFDDFVAAGHTDLQLMPSDRFPSLTPGFWNLYVGGFPDNAAAVAYCEQYGLAVPTDCFPQLADPNAPAGG